VAVRDSPSPFRPIVRPVVRPSPSLKTNTKTLRKERVIQIPTIIPKYQNLLPVYQSTMEPIIHTIFEPVTGTWQYVVADPSTKEAVIIDSVLDFDAATATISTGSADKLLALVAEQDYTVVRILETHCHADHLTASRYLQGQLESNGKRPEICIGSRIKDVQGLFGEKYGIPSSEMNNAFDHTFADNETFNIGSLEARVLHLPGHTPDHIGYLISSNVFTGDSIFNADVGSARCDFPGGSATALYNSIQTLLALPDEYRLYTGHDYPPADREGGKKERPFCTVREQKEGNKHVNETVKEGEFVKWRTGRDEGLAEPKLIHQALQVNVRGGRLPEEADGARFLKVKVKGTVKGLL
jgi:glyoxylase-like metal-dependent hydrolase (beta-lactamase superfamily II)